MKNLIDGNEIPLGLGMALAQNLPAMNKFASMDSNTQKQIIEQTHQVNSRKEMQNLVSNIANWQ